jgi:hypothetical protein
MSELAKLINEQELCLEKLVKITKKINALSEKKIVVKRESQERMTFDEFIDSGLNFGAKYSGVVPGAFFPKKKLPLVNGQAVGLVDVAKHLDVKIIKSSDPKQTHISLDFSLFARDDVEVEQAELNDEEIETNEEIETDEEIETED